MNSYLPFELIKICVGSHCIISSVTIWIEMFGGGGRSKCCQVLTSCSEQFYNKGGHKSEDENFCFVLFDSH